MNEHLNQAEHNADFLEALDKQFPKLYFDWKITVVFYIAVHYLRAYEHFNGVKIKGRHVEMLYHSDPSKPDALNPLSKRAFDAYADLFNAAHKSRYQGFGSKAFHMTLLEYDYKLCLKNLEIIRNYLHSKGLNLA